MRPRQRPWRWTKFGPRWVTASELLALALERDLLGSIVRDKAQRAQKIRLGKALSIMRDRHLASYRVLVAQASAAETPLARPWRSRVIRYRL